MLSERFRERLEECRTIIMTLPFPSVQQRLSGPAHPFPVPTFPITADCYSIGWVCLVTYTPHCLLDKLCYLVSALFYTVQETSKL